MTIRRGDATNLVRTLPESSLGRLICIELASQKVTKNHAEIRDATIGWFIKDEKSKNGTLVNSRKLVNDKANLTNGSMIEIGPYVFIFRTLGRVEQPRAEGKPPVECETSFRSHALATFNLALADRFGQLRKLAPSNVPVLVLGETGTGKERVARAVHDLSGRAGPFVAVNCGAIPSSTMEAELFGHKRYSFTGAQENRAGYFRTADKGTLFLDEVGDLSAGAQRALLRVLQEREVLPVGADHPVLVDVRVVAATNRNLDAMVSRGEFRADLLARLRGDEIRLPRLVERPEDFGLIVRDIIRRRQLPREMTLSSPAVAALLAYRWPQNIRELENALVRAAQLADGKRVELEHLPSSLQQRLVTADRATAQRPGAVDPLRKESVVELLTAHGGNVTAAAKACNVDEKQVRRWVERHGIDIRALRTSRRN